MVAPVVVTDSAIAALRTALNQRLEELSELATAKIVSEIRPILPRTAQVMDKVCLIRSLQNFNMDLQARASI